MTAAPHPGLSVEVALDPALSLVGNLHGVPPLRQVRVSNPGPQPLEGVVLTVAPEPGFAAPLRCPLPTLQPGGTVVLDGAAVALALDPEWLQGSADTPGRLRFAAVLGEQRLWEATHEVVLLPPTTWPGPNSLPELLAAFVRPRDGALATLRAAATRWLGEHSSDARWVAPRGRPARAQALVEAAVAALDALPVAVSAEPMATGPRPLTSLAEALAAGRLSSLEAALALAALLEQASVAPLVVLTTGPVLLGAWLADPHLEAPASDDPALLRKLVQLGDIVLVDLYAACGEGGFAAGVAAARATLDDPDALQFFVDVAPARRAGVRPLPAGGDPGLDENTFSEIDLFTDEESSEAPSPADQLSRWKAQLLDLTLRNRLLNFRETRATAALLGADGAALEDTLAAGGSVVVRARPSVASADCTLQDAVGDATLADWLRAEQAHNRLYTRLPTSEHGTRMLEIYRQARTSERESGAVTLFVAVGMLRWFESPDSDLPRLAPILLLPVTLAREAGGARWRLSSADDEPRLNVTLLRKLADDFGLDQTIALDQDDAGVAVDAALQAVRRLVLHQPRWEVTDEVWLGRFTFTRFLMWLDLEAKAAQLLEHPVVRHLVDGGGEALPLSAPLVPEPQLDVARPTVETLTVLDADPSQLQALFAAEDGSSFVLQGPPGTGKSQTITNLIGQLLGHGKTALFVSEKRAALEVVKARLDAVGLGAFCLELHSDKANKRAVMDQLAAAFAMAGDRDPTEWAEHAARLDTARAALNAYAAALGTPGAFGLCPRDAVDQLIGLRSVPRLRLALGDHPNAVDATRWEALREGGAALGHAARALLAPPPRHPWRFSEARTWTPGWEREVEQNVQRMRVAVADRTSAAVAACQVLRLPPPHTLRATDTQVALTNALLATPALPRPLLDQPRAQVEAQVEPWLALLQERQAAWGALEPRWEPALLQQDLDPLSARFTRWASAFFLFALLFLWSARRRLAPVARSLPDNRTIQADLEGARRVAALDEALAAIDAQARALLGAVWRGSATSPEAVRARVQAAADLRTASVRATADLQAEEAARALDAVVDLASTRRALLQPDQPHGVTLVRFVQSHAAVQLAQDALADSAQLHTARAFPPTGTVAALVEQLDQWHHHLRRLRAWTVFCAARAAAEEAGLGPVGSAVASGDLPPELVEDAVRKGILAWWWETLAEEDPHLSGFRGVDYEVLRSRFVQLDTEAAERARDAIVARVAARIPSLHAPGDEAALLRRQLQLKRRHLPLRELFSRVPETLSRLKPCLLMSPLSIARTLDPSLPGVDVVIFDEASQIPPWDAIGAIARGRQVVIVGDSKQLPPTRFFDRQSDDDGQPPEDGELIELESILEEAVASGLPQLSLRWHYRSRHESLIAFSNHHYYNGDLRTFPAAGGAGRGVEHVHVPGGTYDRGRSRTNRAEADAVVAFLLDHLRADPARSVGVVTFSIPQQRLIEDLVDAALVDAPELAARFSDAHTEPVFIKNLETVQGDERDVMLFSIGYGPDRTGRVTMRFGPLNREGGERRLNVAITRARERLVVFSTLLPEQIDLRRTRAVGVAHLKTFLDYARRGVAAIDAVAHLTPSAEPESPLEREVLAALRGAGHEVVPQVGVGGYRIDLAVVDPDEPGRFLLGVECDGATWHSSRNARERDRLRQAVLERLGWRLTRVWSTDWWHDPEVQTARLLDAVEQARLAPRVPESPRVRPRPQAPAPVSPPALAPEPPADWRPPGATAWSLPRLSAPPQGVSLTHIGAQPLLQQHVSEVLAECAPLHADTLVRALLPVWGLSRSGARIRAAVRAAWEALPEPPRERDGVLWGSSQEPAAWRGLRRSEDRPLDEIPLEERVNALEATLRRSKVLDTDTLVREAAALFGVGQVGRRVRAAFAPGLEGLASQGRAHRDGDRWTIAD